MTNLSTRLMNMAASETVAMNQKSKDLQAQGVDIINLSVGEPDFNTPDHIKEALKKAVENNLQYEPDQIVVCSGAKHCIVNVLLSVVDPGDEVIIPAPYWVSYAEQVKFCEGKNVILSTTLENDFKITPEQLEYAITPKTKVFLICSPSNPTGTLYTREDLEGLAKVLARHERIIIIADEIYEHINFSGKHESIGQFEYLKDRVVVVNGVSKGYAMTGYRIGYLAAPVWIAKAVVKLQGQFTSGATSAAQIASVTALTSDQSSTRKMNVAFKRRRDYVLGRLEKMKGVKCNVPQGAFYVFPDMSAYYGKSHDGTIIKNSPDLCMYLLEKGHIATVPGSAFGEGKCIRISFATSDENLEKAMDRLEKALIQLKD
jgi:aspartate aminotransferase